MARTVPLYIRKTQELGILPQVVTVSQAWSGWHDEGSIWKIPPAEFSLLLRQAKRFITEQIPPHELGSRMLLLDNWNEWGEGHYIAPYREYGFGYLDAVREVFSRSQHRPDWLRPRGCHGIGAPGVLFSATCGILTVSGTERRQQVIRWHATSN